MSSRRTAMTKKKQVRKFGEVKRMLNPNDSRLKSNKEFWVAKIERNMQRDNQVNLYFDEKGFTVMRFWEHQIKTRLDECVNQVMLFIESSKSGLIPNKE